MKICKDEFNWVGSKSVNYTDILDVITEEGYQDKSNPGEKMKGTKYMRASVKKRWSFKFTVRCTHRLYELMAPSEDE